MDGLDHEGADQGPLLQLGSLEGDKKDVGGADTEVDGDGGLERAAYMAPTTKELTKAHCSI